MKWLRSVLRLWLRWFLVYAVLSTGLAVATLSFGVRLDPNPAVHTLIIYYAIGHYGIRLAGAYLVIVHPVRVYFRLQETGVYGWRWLLVPFLCLHPLVILAWACEWLRLALVGFTDLFAVEVEYKHLGSDADGTKHYRAKPYIRALRGIHRR